MICHPDPETPLHWIAKGAATGVAGGLAEVVVVGAYARVAGVDAAGVAGAIATAVGIAPGSAAAGLAVHLALSAALGVLLFAGARAGGGLRDRSGARTYAMGLLALGAVWGLNFFVVLPIASPAFVHLLPYPVTLASKLMFAVAAVAMLRAMPPTAGARPAASIWRRRSAPAA